MAASVCSNVSTSASHRLTRQHYLESDEEMARSRCTLTRRGNINVWLCVFRDRPQSAACGENLPCNYRGGKTRETAIDRDKIESVCEAERNVLINGRSKAASLSSSPHYCSVWPNTPFIRPVKNCCVCGMLINLKVQVITKQRPDSLLSVQTSVL